jgi:hypothetical protein
VPRLSQFWALSLVRWTWGHAGDAGKVSSKADMARSCQPLDLVDHRLSATVPEIWNPRVGEKCSGATLAAHVIT